MQTLEVSLPAPLREFVDAQVTAGTYKTPSGYIAALVEQARKQAAKAKLEALVLEGLESGVPIEVTPEYWERKRRSMEKRAGRG